MRHECMRCIRVEMGSVTRCSCWAIRSSSRSCNAERRLHQTIDNRCLGDRLRCHFVFDCRMGGPCFHWSKQARSRDSSCHGCRADDFLASSLRRDTARPRLSHRQLSREREALVVANYDRHRVDRSCVWFLTKRPPVALALSAGPTVGFVSAVRVTGLHQSSRSDLRWSGLEKSLVGGPTLCPSPPAQPVAVRAHTRRWHHLGHGLSKTAEPLCTRAFPRHDLDYTGAFCALLVDKQPARRLQILRLSGL